MDSFKFACVALACLAGCDGVKNFPRPLAKTATLDLYVVSASSTPGSQKAIDPATKGTIYLSAPAIMSAADIATIQCSETAPDSPCLTVNLTPAGANKLAAATANPAGMQVAVVINGTLIAVPKLNSQLSTSFCVTCDAKSCEQAFASLTDK